MLCLPFVAVSQNLTTQSNTSTPVREMVDDAIRNSLNAKTLTLKGGVKYTGEVKGKKPNGYGRAEYPEGAGL